MVAPAFIDPARAASQRAPEFNSTVWAIAFRGNTVYAGGSFTSVKSQGRTYVRKRLVAFDARTGAVLPWNPVAKGTVRALAVAGGSLYAGGDFTEINGLRRSKLARFDGSGRLSRWAPRVGGGVTSLAIGQGRVYAAGQFHSVDGVRRGNLAAFRHATGKLDPGFRAAADSRVRAVAVTRTRLYLGGDFHKVNGSVARRLAAVSTGDGRLIRTFRPAAPATVMDLAVSPSGLSTATGGPGGRAVGYTPAGRVRWTHLFDGDVHTLAVLGRTTYVGGHFDRACKSTSAISQRGCRAGYASRIKLAALDDRGRLTGWNPRANGAIGVQALSADSAHRRVAAGGAFTAIGGSSRERFALFGG
ncbi:hypothetical protein [Actinoplanes sp. RD1]|uniref:hypothetical protein n=1 Tax=Actinoplanes sp. RD1 TaxID=3064538 RepID=UPI002740C4F2|nr:hypothetical protein [Actinoplanes sp. RD1]